MAVDDLTRQYADQLELLLPPGRLEAHPVGPNTRALIEAIAEEFARTHERVVQLAAEQAPRSTSEMISDWEKTLGLPDACVGGSNSIDERRAQIMSRLAVQGGNSRAATTALALALGYPITIEEHIVLRVGFRVGDRTYGVLGGWPWTFTVHAPVATARFFYAGSSGAGDPLSSFSNTPLECSIQRTAAAHAHVLFSYDQAPSPADYQPWGVYVIPEPLILRLVFPTITLIL